MTLLLGIGKVDGNTHDIQETDGRFFLDGWLNILYLVVFVTIVYILRPTAHNKRFAMSEEVYPDNHSTKSSFVKTMMTST